MDKKIYIECDCSDFDHTIRLWYYKSDNHPEDEFFSLDYKINKWLTSEDRSGTYDNGPYNKWKIKWSNFCMYLKTIKDAILGKPIYMTAETLINKNEALKISKFINDNIN
jgi:hypothetical protein